MVKTILFSTLAVFFFLMVGNAFLFPFFFPEGPVEKFLNTRMSPLLGVHTLALLAAALLLSSLYAFNHQGKASWKRGLQYGVLAGLLVTVPSNLHVFATADFPLIKVFSSTPWVLFTWGLAGTLIGTIHSRRSVA